MAALVVHKFAAMGTRRFILIGYCGGLVPDLLYGEILIVTSAKSEDGVATQYYPGQNEFNSSGRLVSIAKEKLSSDKFPFRCGKIVSTSAMFLETQQVISDWQSQGCIAVDGETAATIAVAEKFNAEVISLLTCSDNLVMGDNLYEVDQRRMELEETAFEKIQYLALDLA
jgi:purine-nucleoside phosphorylase